MWKHFFFCIKERRLTRGVQGSGGGYPIRARKSLASVSDSL
jgi:hypothetical protein